ncbi:zinc finger protein 415-like [Mizuhopecten yessoensis]|uniref:Zinc finger protein 569 n=1 Tax=Mizuhopecten yessoensis TaxID=6573 RepID=A0A210QW05_MIZYE|nr:zinc finger protein 415-like [Mizuhopecten yessoensis]OWF52866.1 Zinc finger protein 569 [Mizuhopecten yessoensis]
MVIFSRVTGAVSSDFVAKFPQHFNFIEMLESVCEETGTRIVNQGNSNFEIVGDWSQMTFVHSMLENTMAIYGAVAMVSSAYSPAKDLKISHNKRMMTPDTNINNPSVRDGHGGMSDQPDLRDRSYTSGNTADRYYDSRVGSYTGNNGDRFYDSRGSPYTPGTTGNRNFDNRGWYLYAGNMADRVHDPRGTSYMQTNSGDKFYDTRGGPYTPGYSGERHYDPRMGPYTQPNMMDRHFDNRERSYTPANIGDRQYDSNVGLPSANINEKNPMNVGDSLDLPSLGNSSAPTGGDIEGTIDRLETTANIAGDNLVHQGEATQSSHGLPGKELVTNLDLLSQISGVQEGSASQRMTTPTQVTGQKDGEMEVKIKDEQDESVTVTKKSLETPENSRDKRTSESVSEPISESPHEASDEQKQDDGDEPDDDVNEEATKSDHGDADYHLDSDTEQSEEVENFDSEVSEESIVSVKVKKRKYRKRRVERPPKRYTKMKKMKKNMLKQETSMEGKRKRGRPRKNTGPDTNIKCPECEFIAKDRKSLYAHNRRAHLNVATNCNICGKLYPSLFDMKRHRILIHNPPKYCCDICGKRYKVNTSLKLHVKSHEPGYVKPIYPCSSCDKSFANPSLLRTHSRRKHEPESEFDREVREVKHFCYICHKTFSSKAALQEHTKIIHMRIYDHQCDQCGKVFGYEKSLATHKLIHSSAKNFVCKICGKAFKQKSCMTIHQAIHMEKKFLCGHCGRGFTQRQSLRRHEIIHRGEKPYSCKLCGQAFNSISTIRRHVILVHKLQKDSSVWREDIVVDTELLASITT